MTANRFGSFPPGGDKAALDTPALVLDLDVAEANLKTMQRWADKAGIGLRPHTKGHKSPALAQMQIDQGATGIACAKLGEAEVMASAGIRDILITTELVGQRKLARLVALARTADLTIVIDDLRAAQAISDAAVEAGVAIKCLIDLNVGQDRTGVTPGQEAVALALDVSRMPAMTVAGLQGYEGHLQLIPDRAARAAASAECTKLIAETANLLTQAGIAPKIVSAAGTGTYQFMTGTVVNEVQPGSYVVMDATYMAVEHLPFAPALTVISTVVSRRGRTAIIDAGWKALTADYTAPKLQHIPGTYSSMGDEHGRLSLEDGVQLELGDVVELLPDHCDTTINLYDRFFLSRGDRIVGEWPISGRGRTA
jgi:D-serine deaminase-like pyridoxal phosphate-dependent protein